MSGPPRFRDDHRGTFAYLNPLPRILSSYLPASELERHREVGHRYRLALEHNDPPLPQLEQEVRTSTQRLLELTWPHAEEARAEASRLADEGYLRALEHIAEARRLLEGGRA